MFEVLRALKANGHNISVVLPTEGDLVEAYEASQIETLVLNQHVPELDWFSLWWCLPDEQIGKPHVKQQLLACVDHVRRWTEDRGIDVFYTNTLVCPIGAYLALLLNKPHVWHVREFIDHDFGWQFLLGKPETLALVDLLSTRVIAISQAIQQELLLQMPEEKTTLIYNGPLQAEWLTSPQRDSRNDGRLRLCQVGTIAEHKGQNEALKALAALKSRGLDCELHFYGTGDPTYIDYLNREVETLVLNEQVHFHGSVADSRKAFLENDIALVCSRFEGFGRVTVEAMSTAMPVIASRTGASPEIIDHFVNGFLYDAGEPQQIADHIEYLKLHPEAFSEISAQARATAIARFSLEQSVDQLDREFYHAATIRSERSIVEQKMRRTLLDSLATATAASHIARNAERYAAQVSMLQAQVSMLQSELSNLRNSRTLMVGAFLTFPIRYVINRYANVNSSPTF